MMIGPACKLMFRLRAVILGVCTLLLVRADAEAQSTRVEPGVGSTLIVNRQPFFPIGWNAVGTCTPSSGPGLFQTNRDSAATHLDVLRDYGVNTIIEPAFADGRIVARAQRSDWYNWYPYDSFRGDRDYAAGHPRPGAYVEGLLWLMDEAMSDRQRPIYSIVSLSQFIKPGYDRRAGHPYAADDELSCDEYQSFIARERELVSESVPAVVCDTAPVILPFWEWNIWYIINSLRDHPGLLGWYLIDEPEGISFRHLFGIVQPDEEVQHYEGPHSLPTPDLLRYVYRRVANFEMMGRSSRYRRRPIIVDIAETNVFFSNRFPWSTDGRLNPQYSSGPFDRTPYGSFDVPADILGLEASGNIVHVAPAGGLDAHEWYWDPNFVTRDAEMLMDVVRQSDSLWGAITVAAQAQIPSHGPYAAADSLRCEPNDQVRTRLLTDRDLIWQLLSLSALGVQGHLFYSHALMPATGEGAEQMRRSNELIRQFQAARLHAVVMSRRVDDEWPIARIRVKGLTDYHRHGHVTLNQEDPDPTEIERLDIVIPPEAYRVESFGRSGQRRNYGAPMMNPPSTTHSQHQLLQTAAYRYEGKDYLIVANSFDASIEISVQFTSSYVEVEEGRFDLSRENGFSWGEASNSASGPSEDGRLRISLRPYEGKVFRLVRE